MKIGMLGTGNVGQTIARKLVALGHEVKMGAREARNEKALAFAGDSGGRGSAGTFAEAAAFGEVVFNCTTGTASLEALGQAGAANLRGKVLVDVANPLDFSKGMPPSLSVGNTDSLAEQIQRALPEAKVVKALSTMNCSVMVEPASLAGGDHDALLCGNDAAAKAQVGELLRGFGWRSVIDLGDLSAARGMEAYLLLWVRLFGALGTAKINLKVVR